MSDEEYTKLKYCIKYKSSEISNENVIPLVKQTIEEAKKKNPEKAKALDNIEITKGLSAHMFDVDFDTILIIIVVLNVSHDILKPIILETWHEIVIPLLKRKLNIETHEDYLKKMEEKMEEPKKEKRKEIADELNEILKQTIKDESLTGILLPLFI